MSVTNILYVVMSFIGKNIDTLVTLYCCIFTDHPVRSGGTAGASVGVGMGHVF